MIKSIVVCDQCNKEKPNIASVFGPKPMLEVRLSVPMDKGEKYSDKLYQFCNEECLYYFLKKTWGFECKSDGRNL